MKQMWLISVFILVWINTEECESVDCVDDSDCSANRWCKTDVCRIKKGIGGVCERKESCKTDLYCDANTLRCVNCEINEHCTDPTRPQCVDGFCGQTTCTTNDDCATFHSLPECINNICSKKPTTTTSTTTSTTTTTPTTTTSTTTPTTTTTSTPIPTPITTFMSCKCVLNIQVNSANCTNYDRGGVTDNTTGNKNRNNTNDLNCGSTFSVQDLGITSQLVQAGCDGCLQMLRSCPRECLRQARSYWGKEGLYRLIVTDTPWGPREKRVGQAFCERYYSSIPPPGVDIISKHIVNECQEEFINMNFYSKLCCAMLDVPVVGRVPIWDYNCNGIIENDEEIMANIMN